MSTAAAHPDSFKCRKTLTVGGKTYEYFSLPDAEKNGLAGISRLPTSLKVLLENLLALRGRPLRQGRRHPRCRRMAQGQDLHPRDRLPPRARADAGLHRRAGGGGPRRHARCHAAPGRRPLQDQPAGAGRPRHRPLRAGGLLRHGRRLQAERRDRVRAQQGALRVPALGRGRLQQLPRGAARHRHLPPGEPGVPGAVGVDQGPGRQDAGLPRYLRRHRQPHHHGERAGCAGLGRGRHRGRGGHAGPAGGHGDPRGDRLPLPRQAQGGRHRHRPGAHLHADAAEARRGGEVRRVLRRRPRQPLGGGPRHHRQHGARVRRHLRLLPGRCRYDQVPQGHRPRAGARRPGGGLLQGPGHVARGRRGARLYRRAGAGPRHRRAVHGRPEAAPGPRAARRRQGRLRRGAAGHRQGREPGPARQGCGCGLRSGPRRRRDRGHHLVHQHLQPVRADRGGPGGAQRAREGAEGQAVGEDLAGARVAGRHGLPRQGRPAGRSRRAGLQPRRLRLHHLHRQLRAASRTPSPMRCAPTTWWWRRCCPATATSRGASTRT